MRKTPAILALLALLLGAAPLQAQDPLHALYYEGQYSFDYDQWPFGNYDGSHHAAGEMIDPDMGWFPDQIESVGGSLGTREDTLTAWCYGAIRDGDELVDMAAIVIRSPLGHLSPGNYGIDLTNYLVMFAFLDDISNFSLPEPEVEMVDYLNALEAEHKLYGTSGSIQVQQVDETGFRGSFSGMMADPGDLTIISVTNGLFDLAGRPTGAETPPAVAEHGAWPSPFNPMTTIGFTLSEATDLRVSVHDLRGRVLTTLAQGRHEAGRVELSWKAVDESGSVMPGGVYLYRIHTSTGSESGKMILLP